MLIFIICCKESLWRLQIVMCFVYWDRSFRYIIFLLYHSPSLLALCLQILIHTLHIQSTGKTVYIQHSCVKVMTSFKTATPHWPTFIVEHRATAVMLFTVLSWAAGRMPALCLPLLQFCTALQFPRCHSTGFIYPRPRKLIQWIHIAGG